MGNDKTTGRALAHDEARGTNADMPDMFSLVLSISTLTSRAISSSSSEFMSSMAFPPDAACRFNTEGPLVLGLRNGALGGGGWPLLPAPGIGGGSGGAISGGGGGGHSGGRGGSGAASLALGTDGGEADKTLVGAGASGSAGAGGAGKGGARCLDEEDDEWALGCVRTDPLTPFMADADELELLVVAWADTGTRAEPEPSLLDREDGLAAECPDILEDELLAVDDEELAEVTPEAELALVTDFEADECPLDECIGLLAGGAPWSLAWGLLSPERDDEEVEVPDAVPDEDTEVPDAVADEGAEVLDAVPDKVAEVPEAVPDEEAEVPDAVPDEEV